MYTLVIAHSSGCRKLIVRNLTIRGHLAVGVSTLSEARELLQRALPRLIVICEVAETPDRDVAEVRENPQLASVPVLVVSAEVPGPRWLDKWNVASFLPTSAGVPELIRLMEPWLPSGAAP